MKYIIIGVRNVKNKLSKPNEQRCQWPTVLLMNMDTGFLLFTHILKVLSNYTFCTSVTNWNFCTKAYTLFLIARWCSGCWGTVSRSALRRGQVWRANSSVSTSLVRSASLAGRDITWPTRPISIQQAARLPSRKKESPTESLIDDS